MIDREMSWDAPGTFNITPEDNNTATGKPIPQTCVWNDQNSDILISPSTNVEDRRRGGVESCPVGTRNYANKTRHNSRISYCEAANRVLTKSDLKFFITQNFIII